jgi:hypothetical protein
VRSGRIGFPFAEDEADESTDEMLGTEPWATSAMGMTFVPCVVVDVVCIEWLSSKGLDSIDSRAECEGEPIA